MSKFLLPGFQQLSFIREKFSLRNDVHLNQDCQLKDFSGINTKSKNMNKTNT